MAGSMGNVNVVSLTAAERWSNVASVPQQREDRLPEHEAAAKWSRVYELFGAGSESSRDEAYAAVQLYFLVNGCSPAGKYARDVRTGGGTLVPIDSVVKITGKLEGEIRQFLRAHMRKSYECIKYSSAVREDRALTDKAEVLGVGRDKAYLLADWLRGCEFLTGEESAIHQGLSQKLIRDANYRRREPVETHRVDGVVLPVPEGGPAHPGEQAPVQSTAW